MTSSRLGCSWLACAIFLVVSSTVSGQVEITEFTRQSGTNILTYSSEDAASFYLLLSGSDLENLSSLLSTHIGSTGDISFAVADVEDPTDSISNSILRVLHALRGAIFGAKDLLSFYQSQKSVTSKFHM